MLEVTYPLKEGRVSDWKVMEEIWKYSFYTKLGLDENTMKNKYILLTEPVRNPIKNRTKMAEIMFEQFGVAGILFEYQALLTLMAEGK